MYNTLSASNPSDQASFHFFKSVFRPGYFKHDVRNYLDFFRIAESGLPKKAIWHFMAYFNINATTAAYLLNTSPKTIYSWKNVNSAFDKGDAVQLLALTELFEYGKEVFNSSEDFLAWLRENNKAIGGLAPIVLLCAPYGVGKIKDLLLRIEHGVYS